MLCMGVTTLTCHPHGLCSTFLALDKHHGITDNVIVWKYEYQCSSATNSASSSDSLPPLTCPRPITPCLHSALPPGFVMHTNSHQFPFSGNTLIHRGGPLVVICSIWPNFSDHNWLTQGLSTYAKMNPTTPLIRISHFNGETVRRALNQRPGEKVHKLLTLRSQSLCYFLPFWLWDLVVHQFLLSPSFFFLAYLSSLQ